MFVTLFGAYFVSRLAIETYGAVNNYCIIIIIKWTSLKVDLLERRVESRVCALLLLIIDFSRSFLTFPIDRLFDCHFLTVLLVGRQTGDKCSSQRGCAHALA